MGLLNEGSGASDGNSQAGAGGGGTDGGGSSGGSGNAGAQGGQTSWRDSLPQELREDPSLKAFNDPSGLAKSYIETKKMVGKKGVIVPTDKDGDDAWGSFFKQIGLPESPD
jgi:hypothetical protein